MTLRSTRMCEQCSARLQGRRPQTAHHRQPNSGPGHTQRQPKPVADLVDEIATQHRPTTAALSRCIDGLVRWIVTKMSATKTSQAGNSPAAGRRVAVAQEHFTLLNRAKDRPSF
ncbi:unnamed protein product [Lota lota]